MNPSELPVNDYWSDDKSSYLVNDLSKYINFSNVEADEKKIIRQGLEYLVRLYRSKRNRIKITWGNTTSSQFVKNEFRNWLIEQEKKSIATVNNYLHGFDVAQSHHNEALSAGISFYDIDDIKTLQTIFSKYIDGEHSVIGKKYSGAVRSSLKAYLRFFEKGFTGKKTEQITDISLYTRGYTYYENEDYSNALYWFEKAAEQNNDNAQLMLGVMYESGDGVEQNLNKAFEWYEKAASQENAYAQFKLGLIYQMGDICDYKKSFDMLRKSALQGYTRAYSQLAYCYLRGKGVEKNITEAIKWYEKGAAEDDEYCQERLGDLYYEGNDVEKDYEKAFDLYYKATMQGSQFAEEKLAKMFYNGEGTEQNFQIAFFLYKRAAKCGFCLYQLATMYENGKGTKKNLKKAKELYEKMAAYDDEIYTDAIKAKEALERIKKCDNAKRAKNQ